MLGGRQNEGRRQPQEGTCVTQHRGWRSKDEEEEEEEGGVRLWQPNNIDVGTLFHVDNNTIRDTPFSKPDVYSL